MGLYVYSSLLTIFICLGMAFFVAIKGRYSPATRAYFYLLILIAFWALCIFMQNQSKSDESAIIWIKINHIASSFIPVAFVNFVYKLLNIRYTKWLMLMFVTLGAIFSILNFFPDFIPSVSSRRLCHYFNDPGFAYPIFILYFFGLFLFAQLQMLLKFKQLGYVQKKQVYYVFLGSLFGFFGGGTTFLTVYNVDITIISNVGVFCVAFYNMFYAYAIVRHKLMDIDVIIRKTLIFAGLLAFLMGVFTSAAFIVQKILSLYLKVNEIWTSVISLVIVVWGYDPIRNLLINLTDKYLFQKKYDYQKLLKDASKGMSRIESLDHLIKLVVHFITMRMRVKNAGVLTRQTNSEYFMLYHQRGYHKNYLEYRISAASPLMSYLSAEKEALDLERVKEFIEFGPGRKTAKGVKLREYDYAAIRNQMEELGVVCCVPSFLGHELRNVLIMGDKKSGDFYTEDDLNVLFTLAQESAIAIENARLYDEAVSKTHELEKINQQLEYSKGLLMKALKETEIANKQLQDTQAQLIHEQKMATLGRLAASVGHEVNNPLTILSMNVSRAILKYRKNPDVKVLEILDLFDKMEQNIGRIKAVVNTLTGLLKRSEKGKFEPLSLKLILEETLPLVQFQTYLDNLSGTEVEFDVPAHLPLIRGDLERLQEVFLNLFINAYHAMEGRRDRRIHVTTEVNPANPLQVTVNFTDNGSGMSEEVMKKVFTYGFTTKPPGRGSGMGLYMCKYIIELHGGEMRVQSKIGEGTTFTLTLPVSEESGMSGFSEGKAQASH
jgi:signal transduction histidine kinase